MHHIKEFLEDFEEHIIEQLGQYAEHKPHELSKGDKMAVVHLCEALVEVCEAKHVIEGAKHDEASLAGQGIWESVPRKRSRR